MHALYGPYMCLICALYQVLTCLIAALVHDFHFMFDTRLMYALYVPSMFPYMGLTCALYQVLACLIAALVHDFEHLGLNNDYLVKVCHERALSHNDRSKETYYKAKETYYKAKETYYKAKETCYKAKETNVSRTSSVPL